MEARRIRGVLAGAGYFAAFQAEAWRRILEAEIVAAVDRIPGKAEAFAARFGIPRAYRSVEEALERERPDFVDIAARPEAHLELTRAAARRGVHVICQKPMAPSWEECLEMCRITEEAGVRLLIHENWRWQPWYREARRLLDSGRLGKPFQVSFLWRTADGGGPEPYPLQPYFKEMPRLLVYETLVHLLDTFRFLAGEVEWLSCELARLNPAIAGEDQALIQIRFKNGALGLIDGNRLSGPREAPPVMGRLLVEGDRAVLRLAPEGSLHLAEHGLPEAPHPYPVPREGYRGDSVRATQAHLLEALRTGRPSESDGRDYLRTVALVEACYRSAAEGRRVSPEEWREGGG